MTPDGELAKLELRLRSAAATDSFIEAARLLDRYVDLVGARLAGLSPFSAEAERLLTGARVLFEFTEAMVIAARDAAAARLEKSQRLDCYGGHGRPPHHLRSEA